MSASRREVPPAAALAALFDASPDAIISTDRDLRVIAWNAGAERLFGFTPAEAMGQHVFLIVPEDERPEHIAVAQRVLAGEIPAMIETVRRTKSDVIVPVSLMLAPVRGKDGRVAGLVAVVRELTDRQRAERTARRLAAIVESSDDAIISKDLDGTVTSWNRAAEQIFGYAAAEMIGQSIRRIIPAERQSEEDEVLARIRRGDKVDHFETVRQRKDGSFVDISLTVSPVRDVAGRIVGASKVARDITERRQIEAARAALLVASEQQSRVTRTLNEVGRLVASTLNRHDVVQAVTDAATAVTGAGIGAFVYRATDAESGATYQMYALSGPAVEAASGSPRARTPRLASLTFRAEALVRVADVSLEPRHRDELPFGGMLTAPVTIRSYMASPVRGRAGGVIGGLVFGHSQPAQFTEEHERLLEGIASWAAIALENAALYVAAQEANRLKDEFLATLSHELRTPLNAILGYTRMVSAGLMPGEKQARALETVERNASALARIVEDILDVSRIVSGKMRLRVQSVDLRAIVTAAIDAVLPAAEAKGVRIERVLEGPEVPVSGDPDRLQQVLWNLLSNSVKYTPRNGRVQVNLMRANSHVEVIVSDTGIGISAEFLPHVFERFRQADGGISRERGGLGLGLSIAKNLIELHGGTIEAASAGEDHGSTFRIKLPVMILTSHAPEEPRVHPEAAGPPRMVVPDLRGVRVLVVDDEEDARRLVREVLEVTGADVETAASGAEVIGCLTRKRIDVLVADLGMPVMDGVQLIRRVRAHDEPQVRDVPAAALTAYARSEDRTLALQSGFQLHMAKPIEPAELMAAVAALARRPR